MVHRHDCQHNQYGPHRQSGGHKIFLAPYQSIFNMVLYTSSSCLFFGKKRNKKVIKWGGGGEGERS